MRRIYVLIACSAVLMLVRTSYAVLNIIVYSAAIIPLAILLGEFTSSLSEYIGEKKGGLLAATVGNMPELMMGIWSIRYGMLVMTKAAIIGSIVSNMLLVLGISIFAGGIKYREQSFNKITARTNYNMLLLAMSAIIVMASLNNHGNLTSEVLMKVSFKVALVLILIYILGLVFSLFTHSNLFVVSESKVDEELGNGSQVRKNLIWILVSSVMLFYVSEKLIGNIKLLIELYNIPQEFIGIIFIPLLGNIGENISAIYCAVKNKVNMSLEIAIGSCIQISLFVTPLLIILSYFMNGDLNLIFDNFQIIISMIAVGMSYFVFQDGKTYWFEGAILISIYIMITIGYYYVS